jgi:hypothetical protein
MKEILIALFLGFTFIQAPGGYICAQNSRKVIEPGLKKNFLPSVRYLATVMDSESGSTYMLQRNEINFRALRDFMSRYEGEDRACWFSMPDGGFESYFVKDGYGNRVIYDKKGNWSYSLINYGENKLSANIRSVVKAEYYDLDIVLVEEVQMNGGTDYIITLEDSSDICVVKFNHLGELEVLQELKRELPE